MIYERHCKFCGVPLRLDVDDDYAALGDPHKLIPLASCDRCADFRVKRRMLFERIASAVRLMCLMSSQDNQGKELAQDAIRMLLKRWLKLLSEYRHCNAPEWDESLLEAIVAKPQNLWDAVRRASMTVQAQQEMAV